MPSKFCEHCGTSMQIEDRFCQSCGKQASSPVLTSGQAQVSNQTPIPTQVSAPYAYQTPHQPSNNQFGQFASQMNTAQSQQKTAGRGIILGVIAAGVLIAAVITGVMLVSGLSDKGNNSKNNTSVDSTKTPTVSKDIKKNVKKDATLQEIVGQWKGETQFIKIEGFDTFPTEELPDDFEEMLAQALATPAPTEFEIKEDGSWEIYVDVIMGMMVGTDDFDETQNVVIKELKNGSFTIDATTFEDGGEARLQLTGTVIDEKGDLKIKGNFKATFKQDKINAVQEANFTLIPVAG